MPPMMVAPLRLIPGIMAKHCTSPTLIASPSDMVSTLSTRAVFWRFSAQMMTKPPKMKVTATTTGVNRFSLIACPKSKPSTTAGKKAMMTLSAKRCDWRECGNDTTVLRIFCQYTRITAKIAPV